jgi:nucleoside-diphosphate-sugar epimerase
MLNAAQGHLFCGGLGYCATALHHHCAAQGWRSSASLRDAARAAAYQEIGVTPVALTTEAIPADVTHILLSAPPLEDGTDPLLSSIATAVEAGTSQIRWIGYLSTTGVYGDRGGDWVDEDTLPRPTSDRGARRLSAEIAWRALGDAKGVAVQIFRLPGIYGPGRSALDSLRDGTARRIEKLGQVFSRVHRDDIVQSLYASMLRPHAGRIYNICDDEPAPPHEVVSFAADLLGITPPPLIAYDQADLSPMARSFYEENKRVTNNRMKEELGVVLKYPTYREGLRACLEA